MFFMESRSWDFLRIIWFGVFFVSCRLMLPMEQIITTNISNCGGFPTFYPLKIACGACAGDYLCKKGCISFEMSAEWEAQILPFQTFSGRHIWQNSLIVIREFHVVVCLFIVNMQMQIWSLHNLDKMLISNQDFVSHLLVGFRSFWRPNILGCIFRLLTTWPVPCKSS